MAEGRGLPLRHTQRLTAGRSETTKKEFVLRDQRRDAWDLEKYVDEVTEGRDALLLDAETNATIAENVMKERDALKLEAEELRAKCKDSGEQEEQLYYLTQKYRDITREKDSLVLKVLTKTADNNVLKKERDALKLETKRLRAHCEKASLLEDQLKDLRVQRDFITKERDSFQYRFRRSEKDCKSIKKTMEALRVETEELRTKCKDYALLEKQLNTARQHCESMKKERNAFILKAQKVAQSRGAIRIERDALKLEVEHLRTKIEDADMEEDKLNCSKQHCDNIEKERGLYTLEARWAAKKLETEELRALCKKSAVLEEQLKYATEECESMTEKIHPFRLRAQRTAEDSEFMRKERDALEIAAEILRTQSFRAAQLEEQLDVAREDCNSVADERVSVISEVRYIGTDTEATEEDLGNASLLKE
jgi:chromosome segregation ATPase